ncbi:MAG TPA: tetratricopeptide repeat protein [Thermoanaerobaculia bacterium]|nr:tetratricopeptide repeat protein [Thermoanaerobaculia bacterium]
MKRILVAATVLALAGCSLVHHRTRSSNPYENPFYARFLNTGSGLDTQIHNVLSALQTSPHSAPLHNELGQLLVRKGFPKDAEREFERAVNNDGRFYQAWYNLGLTRAGNGDFSGAERAFRHTVNLMKGHSEALFQMGLIEEKRGNRDNAIDYYAKALQHNPQIIDVRYNPQVLDSKLIPLALLRNYSADHASEAARFLDTPRGYEPPKQATPQQIVPLAPPVTNPATQPVPPKTTT